MVSSFLGIRELIDESCSFIADHLEFDNAVSVWQLSNAMGLDDLKQTVRSYLSSRFLKYAVSSQFADVPIDLLEEILAADDFAIENKGEIRNVIKQWAKHSPDRPQIVESLLQIVEDKKMPEIDYSPLWKTETERIWLSKYQLNTEYLHKNCGYLRQGHALTGEWFNKLERVYKGDGFWEEMKDRAINKTLRQKELDVRLVVECLNENTEKARSLIREGCVQE